MQRFYCFFVNQLIVPLSMVTISYLLLCLIPSHAPILPQLMTLVQTSLKIPKTYLAINMNSLPTERKRNQSLLPLILSTPSPICSFIFLFLLASLYLCFLKNCSQQSYMFSYFWGLKLSHLSASLEMNILLSHFLLTPQSSQSQFCFSHHSKTSLSK